MHLTGLFGLFKGGGINERPFEGTLQLARYLIFIDFLPDLNSLFSSLGFLNAMTIAASKKNERIVSYTALHYSRHLPKVVNL